MRFHWSGVLIVAAALSLCGCATTTIQSSWKAPDASPVVLTPGMKVVAMVVSPNESTRRAAETILASEMDKRGLQGIPAYTIIPTDEIKDKDKAKARVDEAGASGIVVMRVTGQKQEVSGSGPTYMGPSYGGYWGGYHGYGWGAAYSPGYLRTDTIVYIETLVYDLKQDKLVWACQSNTMNPSKAEDFIKELVYAASNQMKKDGVIAESKKK